MTTAEMAAELVSLLESLRHAGSEWWTIERWCFSVDTAPTLHWSVRNGRGDSMLTVARATSFVSIKDAVNSSSILRVEVEHAYRVLRCPSP